MHNRTIVVRLALAAALLIAGAIHCFGQASATGTISGRVTDTSGAAVPAAGVVATNIKTGARYTAATSSDGLYTLQFIQPGQYSVEVTKSGFQKTLQPQVDVIAASNPTVDVTLAVGSVSETVKVKKLRVTERVRWELVAQAPNAFNTPEFWTSPANASGLDPRSPSFGVIAGLDTISNAPRQLQVGSRVVF